VPFSSAQTTAWNNAISANTAAFIPLPRWHAVPDNTSAPNPPSSDRSVKEKPLNPHATQAHPQGTPPSIKSIPKLLTIRNWPQSERPREKLLEKGPQALSDAEVLALLLESGIPGHSAVDIARSLLAEFGSLRELLGADRARWEAQRGIGPARYARLMAATELARRHFQEPLRSTSALTGPDSTRRFLLAQLRDRPYEVFCCLFLDNRHRLLAFEEVFRGTIDGASVHPREIVRLTLRHNAASVIAAHNHPSGQVQPSQADEVVTRRLRQTLALIDVRLLDHVIVGDGRCFSFSEQGLL
jgi:DNA repair protein RadC